jgi:septal ring factor EnvC (AmiA/AmiB activator)
VQDANDDLNAVTNDVNNDATTKANDAEWQTYKMEANKTIDLNETRITELQNAIKKSGKTFDDNYKKSITALEDRNSALKTKIADYENNQTDWETFKREFDSDMAGLGKAFEDLGRNNKN